MPFARFPFLLIMLLLALPCRAAEPALEVAFSPDQGATELVVKAIDQAKSTIQLAAYTFTSWPIADALVAAHERGVNVRVVLDKSQQGSRYSMLPFLLRHGILARINDRYAIMHDKFMVIDGRVLESGSFNYTRAAEVRNAENVLIIRDNPVVLVYAKQWDKLWRETSAQ